MCVHWRKLISPILAPVSFSVSIRAAYFFPAVAISALISSSIGMNGRLLSCVFGHFPIYLKVVVERVYHFCDVSF